MQPDTIIPGVEAPQSWNRFSYVSNNPIRFNDPTGHRCEPGDYEPGGYCYSPPPTPPSDPPGDGGSPDERDECDLQCELDNFEGISTYPANLMIPTTFFTVGNFAFQQDLSPAERRLFMDKNGRIDQMKLFRFGLISQAAINQATTFFGRPVRPNGPGNAFQHAYWNALMVNEFGLEFAISMGNAHETQFGAAREEQFMDLYNNSVGQDIGVEYLHAPDHVLVAAVLNAISNGDLVALDANNNIHTSNELPVSYWAQP